MALDDLYLSDGTHLFKLPPSHIDQGDRGVNWTYVGLTRDILDPFDVAEDGTWWTSRVSGGVQVSPLKNETANPPGELLAAGSITVTVANDNVPAGVENQAALAVCLDVQKTIYIATEAAGGTGAPAVLRKRAADAHFRNIWTHNPHPVDGGGNAVLPGDMAIRQSDQLLAAVAGNSIYLRDTTIDPADGTWFRYTVAAPAGADPADLRTCSFDSHGRLWVFDAERVRMLRHERDMSDWHAPSVPWTLPEELAGRIASRENVRSMAFDQRGGTWNVGYSYGGGTSGVILRGGGYSFDGGSSAVQFIGGRWVDENGAAHDIAGG